MADGRRLLRHTGFFDNPKTYLEQILKPHKDATMARMKMSSVVVLVQDTTENYDKITLESKGLGTLKNTKKMECRLHPTIAFTPEKICLGVIKADYWQRTQKKLLTSDVIKVLMRKRAESGLKAIKKVARYKL